MKYINLSGLRGTIQMPVIGLGTWRAQPEEVQNAVLAALDAGYRHIDTAFNYNNEEAIGEALQKWLKEGKGQRDELFITTKLPHVGNRAQDAEKFLNMSLKRLKLDYVDLYLIHMPFSFQYDENTYTPLTNQDGSIKLDVNNDNIATWKVLEKQVDIGLIKAIGVSNFNAEQVRKIYNNSIIKPSILQVEMHAYLQQNDLIAICKELNIAITAYSPLGSPGANNHFENKYNYKVKDFPNILGHPIVNELATKHAKTPGQILLRHLIQKDVTAIPKSSNLQRIRKNINIFDFELDESDLKNLNSLDKEEDGRIFNFLFFKGVEKHPEYPFKLK